MDEKSLAIIGIAVGGAWVAGGLLFSHSVGRNTMLRSATTIGTVAIGTVAMSSLLLLEQVKIQLTISTTLLFANNLLYLCQDIWTSGALLSRTHDVLMDPLIPNNQAPLLTGHILPFALASLGLSAVGAALLSTSAVGLAHITGSAHGSSLEEPNKSTINLTGETDHELSAQ